MALGFGATVEAEEAAAVVVEDDVEELGVGVVAEDGLEDVDGAGVVFLLVVEVGHLGDGFADFGESGYSS